MVSLVTKHDNGTLNLWQITFADKSKFSQVLSIGHKSRASGHRFRVNDITCHPVLPLLLTTSHHNIIDKSQVNNKTVSVKDHTYKIMCFFLVMVSTEIFFRATVLPTFLIIPEKLKIKGAFYVLIWKSQI